MSHIFISYSRKDQDFALALSNGLIKHGLKVWVDAHEMVSKKEWEKEIFLAIESAKSFIFIISPDSLRSTVCKNEIAHAIQSQKHILPVLRREVEPSNLPNAFSSLGVATCREQDNFEIALESVVAALVNLHP